MFGLLIGEVIFLYMIVTDFIVNSRNKSTDNTLQKGEKPRNKEDDKGKENFILRFLKDAKSKAEESSARVSTMPRSHLVLNGVFYALIIMMVIVIRYSPVKMNWLIFLGSFFGIFFLSYLLYWLAKKGKLTSKN